MLKIIINNRLVDSNIILELFSNLTKNFLGIISVVVKILGD